jgi:hypothetical protein
MTLSITDSINGDGGLHSIIHRVHSADNYCGRSVSCDDLQLFHAGIYSRKDSPDREDTPGKV